MASISNVESSEDGVTIVLTLSEVGFLTPASTDGSGFDLVCDVGIDQTATSANVINDEPQRIVLTFATLIMQDDVLSLSTPGLDDFLFSGGAIDNDDTYSVSNLSTVQIPPEITGGIIAANGASLTLTGNYLYWLDTPASGAHEVTVTDIDTLDVFLSASWATDTAGAGKVDVQMDGPVLLQGHNYTVSTALEILSVLGVPIMEAFSVGLTNNAADGVVAEDDPPMSIFRRAR